MESVAADDWSNEQVADFARREFGLEVAQKFKGVYCKLKHLSGCLWHACGKGLEYLSCCRKLSLSRCYVNSTLVSEWLAIIRRPG